MARDEEYMLMALEEAASAAELGEIPVGAVVVDKDGPVLARTHNLCETNRMPTDHAELLGVRAACEWLNTWRLSDCTVYVTLEPCPMCMGASLNARVDKVYFGAYEQKGRSLTGELAKANLLNHKTEVAGGVLGEECSALLSSFFISMRQKQKEEKERKKAGADNFSCEEI